MFCYKCGKQFCQGDTFCQLCGAPLNRRMPPDQAGNTDAGRYPASAPAAGMGEHPDFRSPYGPSYGQPAGTPPIQGSAAKKSPAAIIVAAVTVAVLAIGVCVWLLTRNTDSEMSQQGYPYADAVDNFFDGIMQTDYEVFLNALPTPSLLVDSSPRYVESRDRFMTACRDIRDEYGSFTITYEIIESDRMSESYIRELNDLSADGGRSPGQGSVESSGNTPQSPMWPYDSGYGGMLNDGYNVTISMTLMGGGNSSHEHIVSFRVGNTGGGWFIFPMDSNDIFDLLRPATTRGQGVPSHFTMPDLTGMHYSQAINILQQLQDELEANYTGSADMAAIAIVPEISASDLADIVIRTEPYAGAAVSLSTPISLIYGVGPDSAILVPDLVGHTFDELKHVFRGLNLIPVTDFPEAPRGSRLYVTFIQSMGELVPEGSRLVINVSGRPPDNPPVPLPTEIRSFDIADDVNRRIPSDTTVDAGYELWLSIITEPADGDVWHDFIWVSSSPDIFEVEANSFDHGLSATLIGISPGVGTLTVSHDDLVVHYTIHVR